MKVFDWVKKSYRDSHVDSGKRKLSLSQQDRFRDSAVVYFEENGFSDWEEFYGYWSERCHSVVDYLSDHFGLAAPGGSSVVLDSSSGDVDLTVLTFRDLDVIRKQMGLSKAVICREIDLPRRTYDSLLDKPHVHEDRLRGFANYLNSKA